MSNYDLEQVREAWQQWREAVAVRRSAGEIRASIEEVTTLEQLVTLLEKLPAHSRNRWLEENEGSPPVSEELCSCGHHGEHHVEGGSCYHPVGCATICDCLRFRPVRETLTVSP